MNTKYATSSKEPDAPAPHKSWDKISCNWKALVKEMRKTPEAKRSAVHKREFRKRKLKPDKSKSSSPDIWFDDVDESLINGEDKDPSPHKKPRRNETSKGVTAELITGKCTEPTRYIALDCEMVGTGYEGADSMLARCSLVNRFGHVLYDKYVAPREWVTDFRTKYSGIRVQDVRSEKAEEFSVVQKEVSDLLQGRVLVGHALHNDLKVLLLDHPKKHIRDTAKYPPFRKHTGGRTPSLKILAQNILNIGIQAGEHSSVEDAQVAMKIYVMHSREWEKAIKTGGLKKLKTKSKTKRRRKPAHWRNKRK